MGAHMCMDVVRLCAKYWAHACTNGRMHMYTCPPVIINAHLGLPGELGDVELEALPKLPGPVLKALLGQRRHGGDVHAPGRALACSCLHAPHAAAALGDMPPWARGLDKGCKSSHVPQAAHGWYHLDTEATTIGHHAMLPMVQSHATIGPPSCLPESLRL